MVWYCGSYVEPFLSCLPRAEFSQHILLRQSGSPIRTKLKVGLVLEGFPGATPFQAEIKSHVADPLVFRRFWNVFPAFKNAKVKGNSEVVIGVAAASRSNDLTRLSTSASWTEHLVTEHGSRFIPLVDFIASIWDKLGNTFFAVFRS